MIKVLLEYCDHSIGAKNMSKSAKRPMSIVRSRDASDMTEDEIEEWTKNKPSSMRRVTTGLIFTVVALICIAAVMFYLLVRLGFGLFLR
jgi:hypothetical protein